MEDDALAIKARWIREYEEQFAYRVAAGVIGRPRVSVWLVLLPFLFVYYVYQIQRYQRDVPAFAEGFGRSKLTALERALAALRLGRSPLPAEDEAVRRGMETATMAAVTAAQEAEIAMLAEHYGRLLAADGNDYPALLKSVYPVAGEYLVFLERLQVAEGRVSRAVLAALPATPEGRAAVEKMTEIVRLLREAEARKFYA